MEQLTSLNSFSDPLDQYPTSAFDLSTLKALNTHTNSGNGFRKDYGRKLYITLERNHRLLYCAYCKFSSDHLHDSDDFKHWLMMSVDHVIPAKAAEALEIDKKLWDSVLNLVFCCRVCNDFNQDLKSSKEEALKILPPCQTELVKSSSDEFLRLRRATFTHRFLHIDKEREKARQIYQSFWVQ